MPNFQIGDIKYYYRVHCAKQRQRGNHPVSYAAFSRRLKKMNLHDAIYTPRCEYNVRHRDQKTPIQNAIRRDQINREENILIVDIDELWKIEAMKHNIRFVPCDKHGNPLPPKQPKPTLKDRFISFLKRCQKRK